MKRFNNKYYLSGIIFNSLFATMIFISCTQNEKETFPDGTEIPAWFADTSKVDIST